MSFLNTLNTPKLLEEDGVIKFLPSIYAQQYEIEYRYIDELGRIQNSGSLTIDYDSRANGIGNSTYFVYRDNLQNFLNNYHEDFNINSHNSKYYVSGFLILNTNRISNYKPFTLSTAKSILPILTENKITEIGIQEVITYFEADKNLTEINMRYNGSVTANNMFQNYEPKWTSINYIRYCFNAVDLSTYMNNIQYNSVRIKAKNGRFPAWYTTKNDSSWSNWFYIDYKPDKVLLETYVNNAKYNTLYKYSLLDFKQIVTGTFRENVSVDRPIIEIELEKYPDFNYIYIREFDRFYFVSNIVCSNKNLYIIYCSVDVLMSFRHDIDKQLVLLNRSSTKGSDFLVDELALVEKDYDISIHYGESSGVFNFNNGRKYLTPLYTYEDRVDTIMIVSTSKPIETSHYTKIGCSSLPSYSPFSYTSDIIICDKKDVNNIIRNIYQFTKEDWDESFKGTIQNSTELISSIKMYPFSFLDNPNVSFENSNLVPLYYTDLGNHESPLATIIRIGNKTINVYGEKIYTLGVNEVINQLQKSNFICTVYVGYIEPKNIISNFLDKEPYTLYEIYIPFIGFQSIDSKFLEYEKISISYEIDLSNGETMCILSTLSGGYKVLQVYNTNISIDIPITKIDEISRLSAVRRNDIENENLKERSAIRATKNVVDGFTKGIANVGSGNFIGAASNIIGGVTSAIFTGMETASDVDRNNKLTQLTADTLKASTGQISPSKYLSIVFGYVPYIKKMRQKVSNTYEDLIEEIGKPSNYYGFISSLNGYEVVDLVYLKGVSNITLTEIENLQEILKKGIFIGDRKF